MLVFYVQSGIFESVNTKELMSNLATLLSQAHSNHAMAQADKVYSTMFRYADTIIADAEISEEMVSAYVAAKVKLMEQSGATEWMIEQALEEFQIKPDFFIGKEIYILCNYKGEGEGYSLVANSMTYPIFKSKADSFDI